MIFFVLQIHNYVILVLRLKVAFIYFCNSVNTVLQIVVEGEKPVGMEAGAHIREDIDFLRASGHSSGGMKFL